ncbi:DMT family transporter [Neisseria animalis]|uniref:DMT family transporter n=1 Tax=Neisseria animalis TaxID=492 RepID=A0A5P3MPM2_NEIAN|nr:DMT family transporter [Neisseria animalis]QEY23486.1 DMT family transporter [Neisseria animalis]ROW33334.1 DMT family transporter [Neisseria animalis]VEE09055.1 transporter [Neisseria animalis]
MFFQILALFMWGSSFIAAKYAYTMLDAVWAVQIRLLIAALLVLPACRRVLGRIPKDKWKSLLWLAFGNYVAVLMLQLIGVQYTSAASAVTIVGLEPILMVMVGHFFFRDKAEWYHWLCGAAAFFGVLLLILGGGEEGGEIDLFGCLLVFLAGLVFCLVMRPTQKLIADIGAAAYTPVSIAAAAVMCLPVVLVLSPAPQIDWNVQGIAALLYLGIGCSWFAYWLWNKGMNSVSANLSGLLISLEPVFGVLLAVVLLGERLSPLAVSGVVVVIAAALLAGMLPKWLGREKAVCKT